MGNTDTKTNWLTIDEAATYLRCGERLLREMVSNQKIPHVMFAGKALFHRERLDAWLLSQEKPIESIADETRVGSLSNPEKFDIILTCPRDEIDSLITMLLKYKEGKERFVNGLGRNLRRELDQSDYRSLPTKVYAQLSRWCHPRRHTEREKWAGDIARRISICLFGRVIDRTFHPSYRS